VSKIWWTCCIFPGSYSYANRMYTQL
jgi:hypothetical protein